MAKQKLNEESYLEVREIIRKEVGPDKTTTYSRWKKVDEPVELGSKKHPLNEQIVEFRWIIPEGKK